MPEDSQDSRDVHISRNTMLHHKVIEVGTQMSVWATNAQLCAWYWSPGVCSLDRLTYLLCMQKLINDIVKWFLWANWRCSIYDFVLIVHRTVSLRKDRIYFISMNENVVKYIVMQVPFSKPDKSCRVFLYSMDAFNIIPMNPVYIKRVIDMWCA